MNQYLTQEELDESKRPIPEAPRSWRSTDLSPEEWNSYIELMAQDYEDLGDPWHPFHMRSIG